MKVMSKLPYYALLTDALKTIVNKKVLGHINNCLKRIC